MTLPLVLASSSPYRRALLARLGLPFVWQSPAIDETPLPAEAPVNLSVRLAHAKAMALSSYYPAACIIGSDQVCELNGRILHKPGTLENARAQLRACSGHTVKFHTSLCLLDSSTGSSLEHTDCFVTRFRTLPDSEIGFYLAHEDVLDCAGSFKAEGLGITLFENLHGEDFHSLIGLPLLSLCRLLRQAGINPLAAPSAPS